MTPHTNINDTLQRLVDAGLVTAAQVAFWCRVSPSTAHRWITGPQEPSTTDLSLIYSGCPNLAVKQAILDLLTGGQAVLIVTANLTDIDGDGRVTARDVHRHLIEALAELSKAITESDQRDPKRRAMEVILDRLVSDIYTARKAMSEVAK